ncbi:pterin 4 alpha carbinolamine dehydratase [Nitzschia inconspicua]|uniref:Pterin 4 alpha carbinolamine dehydratase n=1 Tax=Nitzschia inconspicua TaxID=303405 RepID=A0A9K3LAM2_9STRA|nr:pterin 4 alpha carbinolamine dehydratase [Nitzschia inconspicua]
MNDKMAALQKYFSKVAARAHKSNLSLSIFSNGPSTGHHHNILSFQRSKQSFYSSSSLLSSPSSSSSSSSRPDPFARRPTAKCDPYGQGGKPLNLVQAASLLPTVDTQWKVWRNSDGDQDFTLDRPDEQDEEEEATVIPFALVRDYYHAEYLHGAEFIKHVAAVAQINNHFPYQVSLDRFVSKRTWHIRTRVICRTIVLEGLSHHDFMLATLLDVETNRPELRSLLLVGPTTTSTTTP